MTRGVDRVLDGVEDDRPCAPGVQQGLQSQHPVAVGGQESRHPVGKGLRSTGPVSATETDATPARWRPAGNGGTGAAARASWLSEA